MWIYQRLIRMRDTDATGALFFGAAFDIAVEAFEEWLHLQGTSLKESSCLLPIVHAEADYLRPIYLGDQLSIQLKVEKVGTTSFTIAYTFIKDQRVGEVKITHVAVSRNTGEKIKVASLHFSLENL